MPRGCRSRKEWRAAWPASLHEQPTRSANEDAPVLHDFKQGLASLAAPAWGQDGLCNVRCNVRLEVRPVALPATAARVPAGIFGTVIASPVGLEAVRTDDVEDGPLEVGGGSVNAHVSGVSHVGRMPVAAMASATGLTSSPACKRTLMPLTMRP